MMGRRPGQRLLVLVLLCLCMEGPVNGLHVREMVTERTRLLEKEGVQAEEGAAAAVRMSDKEAELLLVAARLREASVPAPGVDGAAALGRRKQMTKRMVLQERLEMKREHVRVLRARLAAIDRVSNTSGALDNLWANVTEGSSHLGMTAASCARRNPMTAAARRAIAAVASSSRLARTNSTQLSIDQQVLRGVQTMLHVGAPYDAYTAKRGNEVVAIANMTDCHVALGLSLPAGILLGYTLGHLIWYTIYVPILEAGPDLQQGSFLNSSLYMLVWILAAFMPIVLIGQMGTTVSPVAIGIISGMLGVWFLIMGIYGSSLGGGTARKLKENINGASILTVILLIIEIIFIILFVILPVAGINVFATM